VKYPEQSGRKDTSSNKSRNTKPVNNASSDRKKEDSQSLEGTIRKIIQDELAGDAFSKNLLSYMFQQAKKCEPVRIEALPISAQDSDEESIDGPMEIYFVRKKEPDTSIASIKCKIGRLKIPAMALDSCSEIAIITEDIVLRIGAVIDKSIKHDLSGIATVPIESIGIVHNLPITLAPGFTIYEDFIVVKYSKPMLIFSNPLLKKYKCAIDWDKDELKIPHNGVDIIIPVTMHKVKNMLEVNCTNITPECDDSMVSNKISQSLSEDGTLKKTLTR
jgi:hypothetical protein